MQLVLQGAYLDFFPDLRAYVERRLAYALIRCKASVKQATVSLKNRRSARLGAEWTCLVRIALRGKGRIVAKALKSLPSEAIDDAIGRLAHDLRRKLQTKSPLGWDDAPLQPTTAVRTRRR